MNVFLNKMNEKVEIILFDVVFESRSEEEDNCHLVVVETCDVCIPKEKIN